MYKTKNGIFTRGNLATFAPAQLSVSIRFPHERIPGIPGSHVRRGGQGHWGPWSDSSAGCLAAAADSPSPRLRPADLLHSCTAIPLSPNPRLINHTYPLRLFIPAAANIDITVSEWDNVQLGGSSHSWVTGILFIDWIAGGHNLIQSKILRQLCERSLLDPFYLWSLDY